MVAWAAVQSFAAETLQVGCFGLCMVCMHIALVKLIIST